MKKRIIFIVKTIGIFSILMLMAGGFLRYRYAFPQKLLFKVKKDVP